jgi:carbamoyltransferase
MGGADLLTSIATHLVKGKVVGWFQGRMEFGPRALGNRSILGNPALENMKEVLNLKIKKREGFRPFAPMVLDHAFGEYFVDQGNDYSRMLYVTQGTEKAKQIPSCIHEDNSARVQRIDRAFNPLMYDLLSEFHSQSGIPVIINTSFNERGEPVVNTPDDAVHCFLNTDMDVLVMGELVALKEENLNVEFKARSYAMD